MGSFSTWELSGPLRGVPDYLPGRMELRREKRRIQVALALRSPLAQF